MWPLNARKTLPAPEPEGLVYVVADIHGCLAQLLDLMEKIQQDAGTRDYRLVALGDYIDKGPDSAGVLALLASMGDDITALMGNHERMLIDFLDRPDMAAVRWLSFGGEETLRSYGVSILLPPCEMAMALEMAMGEDLITWLRSRPLWWQSGNLIAVHAQTDPILPMAEQLEKTLLWRRPPHRQTPRFDGNWVIHGHTTVPRPNLASGHIAIDLGVDCGNPLIAAAFDTGNTRFLSS